LVIGTATYTDPGFRQLRAPAQDVADIVDVLADPAIGGFTVTQVLNRAEYEIRRAIGAFLADRRVDDLVVVYLSCHGVLDARGRLYSAATDTAKSQLSSTGVESAWLLEQLEHCRARRQVLILDCCFSGSFAHTKGDTEVDLERRLVGAGRGRAVLTASRAEEYSYEGTPLPGVFAGSVFTSGLVDGLRSGQADRDGDGYISVEEAYAYAANQVNVRGGAQSPQRWLYGAEGDIMLARNPRGATPAVLPEALQRVAFHGSPASTARDLLHQANPPMPSGSGRVDDHVHRRLPSAHLTTAPIPSPPVPQRPKEVTLSFWLWVTSLVAGLVSWAFLVSQYDTIGGTELGQVKETIAVVLAVSLTIDLLFSAVQLMFAFSMRKGRNGARIAIAVTGVLRVLLGLFSLVDAAGGQLALLVITLIISIGAMVTMFLPGANPWFRPRPKPDVRR